MIWRLVSTHIYSFFTPVSKPVLDSIYAGFIRDVEKSLALVAKTVGAPGLKQNGSRMARSRTYYEIAIDDKTRPVPLISSNNSNYTRTYCFNPIRCRRMNDAAFYLIDA